MTLEDRLLEEIRVTLESEKKERELSARKKMTETASILKDPPFDPLAPLIAALRENAKKEHASWDWLWDLDKAVSTLEHEFASATNTVRSVSESAVDLKSKSTILTTQLDKQLVDQSVLEMMVAALEEKQSLYTGTSEISRALDVKDPSDTLAIQIKKIDEAVSHFESNPDYVDSATTLQQYHRLRSKACSVGLAFGMKLIERMIKDSGAVRGGRPGFPDSSTAPLSHALLFDKAEMIAESLEKIASALSPRNHPDYTETLRELEDAFAEARAEYLGGILNTQKSQGIFDLLPATRKLCSQILGIAKTEESLHYRIFKSSHPAVETLLGQILVNRLAGQISDCHDLDVLRDIAESLALDLSRARTESKAITRSFTGLFKLAISRLSNSVRIYIREEISRSKLPDGVVYPEYLFREGNGMHPALSQTLRMLSKVFSVLDKNEFAVLASEAIRTCVQVLEGVSSDALFLIGHYLVLREQFSSFECDLGAVASVDASLNSGVFGFLLNPTPSRPPSSLEMKRWMDDLIANQCERFIEESTRNLLAPLVRGESLEEYGKWLKTELKTCYAKIRAYLTIGGNASGKILFDPIERKLLDAFGQVEGATFGAEEWLNPVQFKLLDEMQRSGLKDVISDS